MPPKRLKTVAELLSSQLADVATDTTPSQSTSQVSMIKRHLIASGSASSRSTDVGTGTNNSQSLQSDSNPLDSSNKKRGRGRGKGLDKWNTGVKYNIQLNDKLQVMGDLAQSFVGQLGLMVRNGNTVPITYLGWEAVPEDIKEQIWQEVKNNVNDIPEDYKENCLKSCNKLWKDHKCKLKTKHFTPYKSLSVSQICSKMPEKEGLVSEQWKEMVQYWKSPDAQKEAEINSGNRQCRGPSHTTGRTHFAQIRYQMEENGERTDKMSVFKKTRSENDFDVADLIKEFERELSKVPECDRTIEVRDRIFHELVGKDGHGYCRTYGSGVSMKAVYENSMGRSAQSLNVDELTQKITEDVTQKVIDKVMEQFSEFQNQMEQLDNKWSQLVSLLQPHEGNGRNIETHDAASGHDLRRESVEDMVGDEVRDEIDPDDVRTPSS